MSSRDAPVLLGRAILERLSATPDVAQSPIKELQNGKSSHGRHVSELAVPTWTNEQKDAPESQDKFAAERASGPKKAEPWPLSNRSAQFQLIEEGWQTPEPLAPLRTTDVKFGLHPRDKVTADYYQAIHGTGYPSFHLDKSGGAGGFEPQRSVLQLEGHGKNRMGLSLLAHQACPPEDPHLAGQKNKSQVLFVEQAVYSPYEEGDSSKVPEGSGEQGSQLADSKIGDLQYTPINQLSHKKTMGHEQRRAIAPPAKGPQNQGTIGDIGETTASTNLTPSRHRVALSPRPLATSNKDRVIWPNVQLEAAEAERGRPITRLTNRHDQDLLPRRLSAIRNTNDVKEYLPCGHTRGLNRNETYCNERVNKKTPYCGHEANVECSNPMKRWQCKIVCGAHLPCAHYCARECFQCLHEIKIDGTPIWNHHPCHVCMNIRAAEEKRKGLRREVNQHAANVADRA
ncbi:uncharacterized protein DFL_000433 [Arthrobotrys flagrans]|uniref:Uncharacterized protein n=1 Tax=Arthrobotrys flagrans TaxID=97331 RepID=A0A437ADQ9_ARTFL|nr:hypothetical protein DFL_000433 [Arthrobotrys flagrans]